MGYRLTSHESFSHDDVESFGYDWERIGDPSIAPQHPLKIYLPETTEELVAVVKEAGQLKQRLTVRSKGHSSNDLVLSDRGAVLGMQRFRGIVHLDPQAPSVTIRAGTVLAELDEELARQGLGLKVIGDHNHITAGGFASVGGISPSSHKHGLFLDTVSAVEFVDWTGAVLRIDRESDPQGLSRVLGSTGQLGVLTTLTLDLMRVDKWGTILRNRRFITSDMDKFIGHSWNKISAPEDALMERGVWLEYPIGRFGTYRVGQFSAYHDTAQTWSARLRNRLSYGWLHFLGRWAGRLPSLLDKMVKLLGMMGIIYSPKFASIKNVETFTDKVIDSSVGDPTRMLIVLAPISEYRVLFTKLHDLLVRYRDQHKAFSFISFYVKGINSEWLSGDGQPYCELMLYLGCKPASLGAERLAALIADIDQLTINHGALRYMHTKTSQDAAIRAKVDPHARHAGAATAMAAE